MMVSESISLGKQPFRCGHGRVLGLPTGLYFSGLLLLCIHLSSAARVHYPHEPLPPQNHRSHHRHARHNPYTTVLSPLLQNSGDHKDRGVATKSDYTVSRSENFKSLQSYTALDYAIASNVEPATRPWQPDATVLSTNASRRLAQTLGTTSSLDSEAEDSDVDAGATLQGNLSLALTTSLVVCMVLVGFVFFYKSQVDADEVKLSQDVQCNGLIEANVPMPDHQFNQELEMAPEYGNEYCTTLGIPEGCFVGSPMGN